MMPGDGDGTSHTDTTKRQKNIHTDNSFSLNDNLLIDKIKSFKI